MNNCTKTTGRPVHTRLVQVMLLWTLAAGTAHDAKGRIATIGLVYDGAGRIEQLIHPGWDAEIYTYNGLDMQETVKYGRYDVVSSTSFNPSGQILAREISTDFGGPGAFDERHYDGLDRLTGQRLEVGGQDAYHAAEITYDEWGYVDRIQRQDSLISDAWIDYDYTSQGQLRSYQLGGATSEYAYDPQGNLISQSGLAFGGLHLPSFTVAGTYDTANRLQASGWEYDEAGRLTADDRYLYAYNRAGRLATVMDRSGNLHAHYLYDAAGLRVRKLEETSVTYYYRDEGGRVIREETLDLEEGRPIAYRDYVTHNGDNVMTTGWNAEGGFNEGRLVDRLGNPAVRWRGDEVIVQELSPFGYPMNEDPTSQHTGPYDYTGHERDAETGLIYMKARYFDALTARFNRPDPARDFDPWRPASHNLYQYTYNNPVNFFDPTGEETDWKRTTLGVIKFAGAFAIGAVVLTVAAPVVAAGGTAVAIAGTLGLSTVTAVAGVGMVDGASEIAAGLGAEGIPEGGIRRDAAVELAVKAGADNPELAADAALAATDVAMAVGTLGLASVPSVSKAAHTLLEGDHALAAVKLLYSAKKIHEKHGETRESGSEQESTEREPPTDPDPL